MTDTLPDRNTRADSPDRPQPAVRRFGVWLLGALGAGVAALIGTVITGAWPWAVDTVKDLRGEPPIRIVTDAHIWPDEILVMEDALHGPDRALLAGRIDSGDESALDEMLRRRKSMRLRVMTVTVVIQGLRDSPIRIVDVRPRILSKGKRPSGTCLVFPPPQGESPHRKVRVNLDTYRPDKGRSVFMGKSVDLKRDERLTVELTVSAERAAYEWDVEVLYDYDGGELRRSHMGLPDGEPFRVTGPAKRYDVVLADTSIDGGPFRKVRKNGTCDSNR